MAASLSKSLPWDSGKQGAQRRVLRQLKKKRWESSDPLAESFEGLYSKISAT